jgi:cobalt-zinc-cadmium efflux system outer membrane protein
MMMRDFKIRPCLLLGVLLVRCSLWAQHDLPEKLTLPEAVDYARQHSPLLQAAREDVRAAEGSEMTAGLRPNPTFNLNSESYPLYEPAPGPFFNRQELVLTVEQPIEIGGKRRWRQRVASAFRESVGAEADNAYRLVTLRVQQAYASVLLAQADLETAQQLLADYDKLLAVNKIRFEKGETSGSELRRAEVERLRFLDDVLLSETNLRNAKAALLAAIGYPTPQRVFETADSIEVRRVEQTLEQLTEDALRARADMMAQLLRVSQAENGRSLQKANALPTPSPFFGYKRDFGMNTLALGIRLPLPLFNRNQGEVARAEAEMRGEQFRLLMTEQRIRQEVTEAFNNFGTQERRLREIEGFYLQRARESRDIAAESYRLGGVDLLSLLDAQRSYREIVRTYNRVRYGAVIARFELEASVGKELQ